MARKSRREATVTTTTQEIQPTRLETAAYCRLSVKDEGDESIQTQAALVHDFIASHPDLRLADTYIDDGFSGTRFDRPDWNRLMSDVRNGKIQCIVVKDLSRFGRNYVEAGYYIETIFPRLGVRFIAVTDDFDSSRKSDMDDLSIPIKNMVNALYARDISRKVATSARLRQQKGELMKTSTPPFGYTYGENKDTLVVDEEMAPVVRMIFRWTLMGTSVNEIAKRLDLLGIPTPRERYRQREMVIPVTGAKWGNTALTKILSNQTYCGDTVTGKTRTQMREKNLVDEENWIITENTHEPIISREVFARVKSIIEGRADKRQKVLALSKEKWKDSPNELAGLAFCGICGRSLYYERRYGRGKFGKIALGKYYCHQHSCREASYQGETMEISANILKMVVMDQVREYVSLLLEKRELLRRADCGMLANVKREVEAASSQKKKSEERKASLYESFVEGVIDKDDYLVLKEHYTKEIQDSEEQYQNAVNRRWQISRTVEHFNSFVDDIDSDGLVFDEKLVRALVERIELGENNSISIRFKFADEFASIIEESVAEQNG